MTLFKRSLELQQQLRGQLDGLTGPADGPAALEQSAALEIIDADIQKLGTDITKMKAKAQETDPDKKVYGKGMADKILALAADYEKLEADAAARKAQLQPLADAERQRQQEAADAAQRERKEQQRRDAELEAQKTQEEARKRREAEAAAQEAARQEAARLAEAERKRKADLAAAEQAATQQRAAAAAEQQRLAEERKAEVLRKQQEQLAARQEAQKAAAAKAAAERAAASRPPPYNANGSLVHLHGGKGELDDILRQTGDRQLVVLDFSASWCGPCRMMEPVLQGWARELGPKVVFVKCDAEAAGNRPLAASSGIRAFPTFHIYRGGRVVGQVQGADRGGLRSLIDAEAHLLAPLEGGPSPAAALAKAMSAMKGRVAPAAFQHAAQTLLAYVRNLVAHPDDARFRRIKTSNARYKAAVGSQPHGAECMAALGFQPIMEASEEVLVLEHPSPELPRVKVLLEQAMALSHGRAAATAPPPAAAAGPSAAASLRPTPVAPPAVPAAAAAQAPAATPSPSAGPAASPEIAQLLAQQLAMAFAQSQAGGQQSAGASGTPSAPVPSAARAGSTTPAQQQQSQGTQPGQPSGGGGGGGGGSGTAAPQQLGAQQGEDKQDEDEDLARALQDSMDDGSK